MWNSKIDPVEKLVAAGAIVFFLIGAFFAVANVAVANTFDSPVSATSALDIFGGIGLPLPKPACSAISGRVCSVLFVGDSFTHGRYTPVRTFNAEIPGEPWQPPQVIDENYGQTGEREEL